MSAELDELQRIHRRVERRVRGEIIFRVHLGIGLFLNGVALIAALTNPYSGTGSPLGSIFILFVVTLGIHIMLRYINRFADRVRETELQRELARAGYSIDAEGRKRKITPDYDDEPFARISDDGELVYGQDDHLRRAGVSKSN